MKCLKEDKKVIDKELKCLCYLGILKEGFSPYSSLVMLISQKLNQDKRVVMDFRHLNVRIAKNNLAYPLVRDTFSVLGNSKYEVLLVLDLKDAFHSQRLLEEAKKYCGILPYFRSPSYIYQRMPMGLNISPSIWQSYINVILESKGITIMMNINIYFGQGVLQEEGSMLLVSRAKLPKAQG